MRIDEQVYTAFQEEMAALEHFRLTYSLTHSAVGLERDDPDVRRLMEAMAFFGARSRLSAERHVLAMRQRLYRQFFSYLLSPLPAMGLLRARPTGQLADAVALPCGAQFLLQSAKGLQGNVRTMSDLRILPLTVSECVTLYRANGGFRILLRLSAPYARNDDIGVLRLHINHLNDFEDSLGILHALERHLIRTTVVYDEAVNETTQGLPCPVNFGLPFPPVEDAEGEALSHPIEYERLRIHFPQQELFLNIEMAPSPGGWKTLTLCFDLDLEWPRDLVLNRDVFQLFVVPVVNLKQEFAQVVTCDGSRERYAILHPQPERGYALHSVLGVYELQKQGMVPLLSGVFSPCDGSYEIDYSRTDGQETPWLTLSLPQAFEQPQRIAVEALWHQPRLVEDMSGKIRILPFSRQIAGIDWELAGTMTHHQSNAFITNQNGFIRLVTLMNKTTFNLADIKTLLDATGMGQGGYYAQAIELLADVRCRLALWRSNSGGVMNKQIYQFFFHEQGRERRPLLVSFIRHAERILDAWTADRTVEVEMSLTTPAARRGWQL